jgi:amino acid adenylation domain-containing protein/thioester reductase-like protein
MASAISTFASGDRPARRLGGPAAGGAAPIPRRAAGEPVPLSLAQERLWFLAQLDPGSAAHNLACVLRLRGSLRIAALARAAAEIERRHEVLRTALRLEDGEPRQVVEPWSGGRRLPIIDLAALPLRSRAQAGAPAAAGGGGGGEAAGELPQRGGAELPRLARAERRRPFDLARGGALLRLTLVRLAPHEHVLLVTLCAAAGDPWSLGIVVEELAALYAGRPLAEPPVQYADFTLWQRRRVAANRLAEGLAYWRQRLQGAPAALELPADRPRPAVRSARGTWLPVSLEAATAQSLGALALAERTPVLAALLAVFSLLLSRLSGERTIVAATPVANRVHAQLERAVGCFANPLPLRIDFNAGATFRQLVSQAGETLRGALAHQELPFARLVEELQPRRDLARTPLFQAMLVLQGAPAAPLGAAGWEVDTLGLDAGTATLDLTLTLAAAAGGLAGTLVASTDLHDRDRLLRWRESFIALTTAAVAQPDAPAAALPLLGAAERHQLLREWNDTDRRLPGAPTVHGLFAAQARRTPAALAVACRRARLDYAALDRASDRLAARLRAADVGPGVLVGIAAERGCELIAGLLGILKAGGAYVPLDPDQPAARLRAMAADAAISLLLVLRDPLPEVGGGFARLDLDGVLSGLSGVSGAGAAASGGTLPDTPRIAALPGSTEPGGAGPAAGSRIAALPGDAEPGGASPRIAAVAASVVSTGAVAAAGSPMATEPGSATPASAPAAGPDDPVYAIFTSGSTGQPKAALNSHGAVVNRLLWMQAAYRLGAADRVLQKTPCGFDVSVWELFWPLVAGATLVLADPGAHRDSAELVRTIAGQAITVVHFVPSLLQLFLDEPDVGRCTSLRQVIASGEALSPALRDRCLERLPAAALDNLYGPTEAAIDVSSWPCRREPGGAVVPIGRPIANVHLHVLDRTLQPAPLGVPGELCIGGAGPGGGYLRRPALTAERFVPDPHGGRPGARLYRTGDLARTRRDGALEFLGRIDHQVKVRGVRIELGEIEAALLRQPAVREAIVAARPGAAGETRLVAWVAGPDRAALAPDRLRAALAGILPEAMVPSSFELLDALPKGAHGKIDRAALPETGAARAGATAAPGAAAPPRTAREAVVAAIWSEVLGRPAVGIHDDFFAGGGHSLAAVRLRQVLEGAFGVALPLALLFQRPTVAGQAAALTAAGRGPVGERGSAAAASGLSWMSLQDLAAAAVLDPVSRALPASAPTAPAPAPAAVVQAVPREARLAAPSAAVAGEAPPPAALPPRAGHPAGARAAVRAGAQAGAPERLLLTGATGSLGVFVLRELLRQLPGVRIECLVRAADPAEGARRVRAAMGAAGVWDEELGGRVTALPGDLERPGLALAPRDWDRLATEVAAIYHLGARRHPLLPFPLLCAANVHGTAEVLRLAAQGRPKPVHHLSTISVLASAAPGAGAAAGRAATAAGADLADEATPLDAITGLHGGHGQSLWVAESLVWQAAARGLPVTVYRTGRVAPDAGTGRGRADDPLFGLLRAVLLLGAAPDLDLEVEMAPVDHLAGALVHLSRLPSAAGAVHHLVHPQPVSWRRFLALLGDALAAADGLRPPLALLPAAEWRALVRREAEAPGGKALRALLPYLAEEWRPAASAAPAVSGAVVPPAETPWSQPRTSCRRTLAALDGSGWICPPLDARLLGLYLRCLDAGGEGAAAHLDSMDRGRDHDEDRGRAAAARASAAGQPVRRPLERTAAGWRRET